MPRSLRGLRITASSTGIQVEKQTRLANRRQEPFRAIDSGFRVAKVSLKPENIARSEEHLTSPSMAVGTAAYMSPEQVRAKELDGRTDLFSFGIVLYQMATGKLPFPGVSSGLITEAILNRDPVAPMRVNPDIAPALQEVIRRALEKDRNLRYQHAADMRAGLQRLKRDTDSGSRVAEGDTESVLTSTRGRSSSSAVVAPCGSPRSLTRLQSSPSRMRVAIPSTNILVTVSPGASFIFWRRYRNCE